MIDHLTGLIPCSRVRGRAVRRPLSCAVVRPLSADSRLDQARTAVSAHGATDLATTCMAAASATGATPVEYRAMKSTVESLTAVNPAISGAVQAWDRTLKFGQYGHFQRWRFAT